MAVGFAWRGSWCGSPAARLRLTAVDGATGGRTVVSVPLTGGSPSCAASRAGSGYIVPGLIGGPESPVQPAPPAWVSLRATIELPATARGDEPVSYRIRLENTGDRPVTLSPCPAFSTLHWGNALSGGLQVIGGGGELPCGRVIVPAGVLQVPLTFDARQNPYGRGVVQVEWAMAGVPTAEGRVRIR